MGQNLFCWCSDIQNTRLSYAHTSYCWSYCTAVTFTSSIIFILTAQLDHRKGIQESCLLPLRQLLLLICNIKGLGRTCSGQRQCWEQISDLHIFADLYFCSSLPVMSSGVLYKQCIPVHPFSCFLSWWNWGTVLQDRIQGMTMRSVCSTKDNVQGGRNKHKSTATVRKRQWEMGLLYIQLRKFWDKLKNPVKTTVACPAIFTPSLNRNNASPLSSLCGEAFPFPGMIPSAGISDPILCCWAYDS